MTLKLRFALTNNIGRQKLLVHVNEVYAHVVHVCVHAHLRKHFSGYMWRPQEDMFGLSLSYSLETGHLMEPRTRLEASKP